MHVLAEIEPLDPISGSRPTLRVCSANIKDVAGHAGGPWFPAISRAPSLSISLFDGDFTSDVNAASGQIELRLDVLAEADTNAISYRWAGSPIRITGWHAADDTELLCEAIVSRFEIQDGVLSVVFEADPTPFEQDVLTQEYAGTTGIEGDANLKGRLKPWLFGRALNVEPVLIDAVNNIYQFSAYGPISAVLAMYERGAAFGDPLADYADYASLVAGAVPEGTWATCLAQGLVRLGAPAYGVITGDVDGDDSGGTYRRKTGEILSHVADELGIDGARIVSTSLTALDADVPRNVNIYLTEQTSFLELAQRMARPCNAIAGVDWQGRLFVSRVAFGAASLTLDVQGRQMPPVRGAVERSVSPPYKRIVMGAQRVWRVHTLDEIAYYAPLIDTGPYDPDRVYREGNLVTMPNGDQYLYINPVPSSGNYPPSSPSHWQLIGGEGISTERYPRPPQEDPNIGSYYSDANMKLHRFEGYPLEFEGDPLQFEGDPLWGPGWVSVRDRALEDVVNDLQALDDDAVFTVVEKKIAIDRNRWLQNVYQGLLAQGAAVGYDTSALTAAWTAYVAVRDSISPAWNDLSQPSNFGGVPWDAVLDELEQAIAAAQAAITGGAGVEVIPPEDQQVQLDGDGNAESGEWPRTLTPTVKRGSNDIRDDDDVSYAIAVTGDVAATVNDTAADPDKGKIAVTAGTDGTVELTVTVSSFVYGPYTISIVPKATKNFFGTAASGGTDLGNGMIMTWREINVGGNATTKFDYGGDYVYSTFAHAWISGGNGGTNAQDNNPYIDYDNGGDQLDGAWVTQARDDACPAKLMAIGR